VTVEAQRRPVEPRPVELRPGRSRRARAGRISPACLLRAARPRQWSKNALVLAAPCAAGAIARPEVSERVAGAFLAFCLLASATYLFNDVRDAPQDRLHPRKRLRPVAAGELSARAALVAGALLALAGLALATLLSPVLGALGLAYLLLTGGYSLLLRGVVALDLAAVAAGFVLRAAAGGAAAGVYLSRAFLVVAALGATFLVVGKRYAELRDEGAEARTRATLRRYSPRALRALLVLCGAGALLAYSVWAATGPGAGPWHALSIAPLGLWLWRYGALVARGQGQSPEEVILGDAGLLALTGVWAALFLGGVYAGR
jgi:decaprenyl-phosphate phosphoribosyltransferase